MVLVAALALVATAFIVTARLEARGSTNALRGLQAEAACRAGLAAAVYRIGATWESCYSIDSAGGWHGYFHDGSGTDLCPDEWVAHYDPPAAKPEMKVRTWPMPRVEPTDPADPDIVQLKRLRGFTAEYCVAVADLDGKLRVNPKNWDTLIKADDAKLLSMLQEMGLPKDTVIRDHTDQIWSLGQMRKAYGLADSTEMTTVESFMTAYPRDLADLVPATGRPPVNVNTAREQVLRAIVVNVPGFDAAKAGIVAGKLVASRSAGNGFDDRREMEKALVELGDPAWPNLPPGYNAVTSQLSEEELNDLLNSLAGANADADSDLDRSATPGLYSYDFDDDSDPPTRDQSGQTTATAASDTWGTEVKFTSRFFHIYALGRTVAADAEQTVLAQRRLHAIYDAAAKKLLWSRWHYYPKANMKD
jgi:hypothetical protein